MPSGSSPEPGNSNPGVTGLHGIEVDVSADEVEWVSGLLWGAGVSAIEERPGPGGIGTTLATAPDLPAVRSALADRWTIRTVPFDERVFDEWRAWARPVLVGRLLVVPAWQDLPAHQGDVVVVRLDPGRAFGHGDHPTTRAVLAEVEARVAPGHSVLDVGTGSGVLAVSAALLGAGAVVAVDISPEAVRAATANAEANGVGQRITVLEGPIGAVAGTFDLVLGNLGAETLVAMADELSDCVAHGGTLVLSGFLIGRLTEVADAFGRFALASSVIEEDWCTLTMTRR